MDTNQDQTPPQARAGTGPPPQTAKATGSSPPEPAAPPSYARAGVDEQREQDVFARAMRPWLARTAARSSMVASITGLSSGYFATILQLDSGPPLALSTDGDTQWMTAGGGILHIEAPPEELVVSGGLFHGIQLWVNLPARLKMTQPRYQDIRAGQVALLSSADGGALLRVIAGSFGEHAGPGITHTPISLLHATVSPGAQVRLPWRADFNALAYVLAGSGTVGAEKRPVRMGQLAVFGAGDAIAFAADAGSRPLEILLLGGEPIREPVAAYGPFVMNTRAELVQAFDDYQAGRLGSIPAVPVEPHPGHDVI